MTCLPPGVSCVETLSALDTGAGLPLETETKQIHSLKKTHTL